MLTLTNLSKSFASGDIRTHALRNVNLHMDSGEYVAIVGPSGSGKSTLLSILGMLDSPDAGEFWFQGSEIAGWNESRRNALRKGRVGFIFQSFNLIDELSVFENVELALEYTPTPSKDRRERVSELLERLGIFHRAKHRPSQLSGGQQQRVAIARALVSNPSILLADEPTGNLDSAHGEEVMDLLREINDAGTTLAMVTHSPEHAKRAKRILHMLDGRIIDG